MEESLIDTIISIVANYWFIAYSVSAAIAIIIEMIIVKRSDKKDKKGVQS